MLQLVSRHVRIEIQEIGFKKFGTELRRVVGLHQILVGTGLEPQLNCPCSLSSGVVITLERNILMLRSNCN